MEKCIGLCESCARVHDNGPHVYCMDKCRRCRQLGDVCSPAQTLEHEYLPISYRYFNGQGYLTDGTFLGSTQPSQPVLVPVPKIEGFNAQPNTIMFFLIIAVFIIFAWLWLKQRKLE